MIKDFFKTEFTIYRKSWKVDEHDNDYADESVIATFLGHIQQASPLYIQSFALAITKAFTIWCPVDTNVKEGDTIYSATDTYSVKGVMKNDYGTNQHLELVVQLEGVIEGS